MKNKNQILMSFSLLVVAISSLSAMPPSGMSCDTIFQHCYAKYGNTADCYGLYLGCIERWGELQIIE